jgi:shikimate kinase/3-dehydroquinate synthase
VEALTGEAPAPNGAAGAGGRRALVFVGFMGAGKSSAARAVADELDAEALDSDRELERELGEPLEAFFDREGEAAFRRREEVVALGLLERPGLRVAALGGGTLQSEAVRQALERHAVVYLDVDPEEAWRRAARKGRPLARERERFDHLHQERRRIYESVANAFLPRGGREVARRALPSLVRLADTVRPSGLRLVWAHAASGDYPVFLARGLLGSGFFEPRGRRRRYLVADAAAARAHDEIAGALAEIGHSTVPSGEGEKRLGRAEDVLRDMARAGVERDDVLVAFGGGVVGDLAGFCAAVYQRGIDWVGAPTTLVAQVDSAFGGKTGVDLPEAKNYAGAYHQPAAVLVDPAMLETLPQVERAAGYAEVVKTALIAGGGLWERVRRGDPPDDEVVLGCLRTKLAVVAEDERDAGRRQVLNLGHTVAHALEAATGYERLRHGEAVGIGLLCALRLSGRESLRAEVAELLEAAGLPLAVDSVSPERVLTLIARDKKRRDGAVRFVLLDSPGAVTPGHELGEHEVRAAVAEVARG